MSRDFRLFLEDIRQSCEKILRYVKGLSFQQFEADEKSLDAVARNLQIIGEAVKRLPRELREQHIPLQLWHFGSDSYPSSFYVQPPTSRL
jgi:uncharacterized protein with HEPN domain